MTSEQVQMYVRVVVYWLCGVAVNHGVINNDVMTMILGSVGTVANVAWTVYGNRLNAKLAEIAKYGEVKKIVTAPAVAEAVPSDKVVAH